MVKSMKKIDIDFKDPMILILCGILAFLCIGAFSLALFPNRTTVVLDANYGGDKLGYIGYENAATVNEQIINRLEDKLMEDDRFVVYRSHDAGTYRSSYSKISFINQKKPDIVVQIDAVGDADETRSGMTILTQLPSHVQYSTSKEYAEEIAKGFEGKIASTISVVTYEQTIQGTFNEVEQSAESVDKNAQTIDILQESKYPVVVVRPFYVSNEEEVSDFTSASGYEMIAETIYQALISEVGK